MRETTINYYGFNPPFFGGHQNVLSRQSGDRIIKNDLLQLLMTERGERVMRPNWGAGLRRLIFELPGDLIEVEVRNAVLQAITTYEPRISADVEIRHDSAQHLIYVRIIGVYTGQPNNTFELELNIPYESNG